MSGAAGAWRVAARLARREVRRRPGRTALVTALVALPVTGMLVAVVVVRTSALSLEDRWRFEHGRADAVVYRDTEVTPGPLPEGSRRVEYLTSWRVVGTAGGELCRCGLSDMPFERLTDGIVTVRQGRPPGRRDEVLLSETAARALGTGLGRQVELTRPFALDATVVGIGIDSRWPGQEIVVVDPATGLLDHDDPSADVRQLVDLPDDLTRAEIRAWEATAGPHSLARGGPALGGSPTDSANAGVVWAWAGGAAGLTVIGIVIAAAFAASARRQLVTLGQLAANGATPALLRRVLFLQGTVTGLLGSIAGLALGAVLIGMARPWADQLLGHAYLGWDVRLFDVLPIVVIAVVAATVAALVPALGASRVSVLAALAGRRPLGRVSPRRTAAGLVAIAGGTGLLGFAAYSGRVDPGGGQNPFAKACAGAGPVLLLLGVCTATPAYVTLLRPVAGAVRGHWRLAARSLFRQRTRTSAMVAAICAISALAVAAASYGLALERDVRGRHALTDLPDDVVRVRSSTLFADGFEVVPPPDVLEDAAGEVQATLPNAEGYVLAHAVEPGRGAKPALVTRDFVPTSPADPGDPGNDGISPQEATIVDAAFRRAYEIDAPTQRLLDEVGAVWFGPAAGRVTVVTLPPAGSSLPPSTFAAGVLGPEHGHGFGAAGELLLTPERAEELGLAAAPSEVILRTPAPLTTTERAAVEQLSLRFEAEAEDATIAAGDSLEVETPIVWMDFDRPERRAAPGLIETVPATIALVFALLVVAVGLALAAAETRDERDVLAVLGAAPRTLRRTSVGKAFLLTLLGGAVAVPIGLLPVAVVVHQLADDLAMVVPWRTIVLVVVVVPVLAAAVTSAATRVASRYRPVRISTASFD